VSDDLTFVSARRLGEVLPMRSAIDALEVAFGRPERPTSPLRSRMETGSGDVLMMPATDRSVTGVKLVAVNPRNPERDLPLIHSVYVLFATETGEALAVFDGGALTGLRTAAVSGLATRHLARPDCRTLMLFGAGVQASAHLEAMRAERPIERVMVVSRTRERARDLAARAEADGLTADVAEVEALSDADLICTCTTSTEPLFDGSLLKPGVHVNAVGAYRPTDRELDTETMARARIVVETREVALAEAGDLLIPIGEGAIDDGAIEADLSEVVRGSVVRRSPEDVTVFKSVGVAFEDLAVAGAAYDRLGG
jgi:ornithine cyclodeaminase